MRRMIPPQERFDPDHGEVRKLVDRLVHQMELSFGQSRTQVEF